MIEAEGDGRYADVLESLCIIGCQRGLARRHSLLSNHALRQSRGVTRQEWFRVPVPAPISRAFWPRSAAGSTSTRAGAVAVDLYVQEPRSGGRAWTGGDARQEADYPWDGQVKITVAVGSPIDFTLHLRVPGWCREAALLVNGEGLSGAFAARGLCARHSPGRTRMRCLRLLMNNT